MPRSGHHLAVRLLQALFSDSLFYCEVYSESGCCKAVPCARRGSRPITYQKSHDFDLDISTTLAECVYLIQHRAPVPLLLSAREHYAELQYKGPYGDAIGSHRGEYEVWLGRQVEYYVEFSRRWLLTPPENSVVVDYRDLASDPRAFLARVVEVAGVAVTSSRIDDAVSATIERAGRFGEHAYVPRSLESSRYLDRDLLAICESLIYAHVPRLTAARQLHEVEFEGTLIWQVFEARRRWRAGDLIGALALVDSAIDASPENGMLFHERATLLHGLGRSEEARDALEIASALLPPHPLVLAAQVDAALTLGDVPAARASAEALVALDPVEPLDRIVLALARSHARDPHDAETRVETIRLLEDELVEREITIRQGRRRQIKADSTVKELLSAADERLRDAEQAHAESRLLREAYRRLSTQSEAREREVAELRETAEERLRLLGEQACAVEEQAREIVRMLDVADERLCLVLEQAREIEEKEGLIGVQAREIEEKEGLIGVQARAIEEKERLIGVQARAIEEKEQLIGVQAQAVEEKERLIVELAAVAEERLQLIERLDADARQARDELERLTVGEQAGEHVAERPAPM